MKFVKTFEEFSVNQVECDNCGWKWKLQEGGEDPYICHKCGNDNTPIIGEGKDDDMVYGIVDLLLKVDDIENRREMAIDAIADFDAEGVEYNKQEFLDKSGLSDKDI